MKRRFQKYLLTISLIGALWALFACAPEETIFIVITPTPASVVVLPTSTSTSTATAEETAVIIHSETPTDDIQITPTETPIPLPTIGEGTRMGPVVPPDYVLPTLVVPSPIIPTMTSSPLPTNTQSGPTATPIPLLDASRIGLQLYSNVGQPEWEGYVEQAERTGVQWIKIQVNWAFLQPESPNVFNDQMQLFERQIETASRPPNMRVMLSIAKAPSWARSVNAEDGPPDNPQALADFITYMLRDTKIGTAVDAIEVWNEPNLIREWRGTLPFSGAGYMQLFTPAYNAIRAYSPTIQIITAGLAPTGALGGDTVDDRTFLQQMYSAGLANYGTDVFIGAHPYGWGNPPDARCCNAIPDRGWDDNSKFFFIENIESVYGIMQTSGHNTKMWITEFGWATWEGLPTQAPELWMTYNTAQNQLNYTIRAFQIGQSLPYVEGMILWNLNFANMFRVEQRDEVAGYSLINPALLPSERPLYRALSQATGYGQ
ncbi:MAG: hypothetical protein SH821_08810 [Phototrophicales bacterium]|nr:hypothetical protein [Phototrophicales bacterium]